MIVKFRMPHLAVYLSLFLVSFAAATVLPAQSEILLAKLLLDEHYLWWTLVLVASAGNILGSVANWLLGRYIVHFRDRRWFPIRADKLFQYEKYYQRYGKWSLLLSWAPFIGDPLTIMAGVLREPFPVFLLLVSIAKVGRYLALAGITYRWL